MVATILPPGMQQFADGNGAPYGAGSVEMYIPATLTLKTTWIDRGKLVQNTNPIRLDANGRCIIYGSGQYRQILKDVFGNMIWDKPVESRDDEIETEIAAITLIAQGGVKQLLNVAQMLALLKVNLVDAEQVSIAGYVIEGDGGGGTFAWDANSVATVNGGTIFDADEGGIGRWIKVERNAQDVRWWGAKGDGIADDTAAIQSAINGGGEILFPYTSTGYKITSSINLVSNTSLKGLGQALLNSTVPGVTFVLPNGVHGVSFEDLICQGNTCQWIGTGVNSGVKNLRLSGCSFTGVNNLLGGTSYIAAVMLDTVDGVWINECDFFGNGIGLNLSADNVDIFFGYNGGYNENVWITDSRFRSTLVNFNVAIYHPRNLMIDNCDVSGADTAPGRGTGGYGILCYNAALASIDFLTITNNRIKNTGGSGFYYAGAGSWLTVADNVIDNTTQNQDDASLPAGAIAVNGGNLYTITGNTVSNSGKAGITVSSANIGTIDGNTVYNNDGHQIYLRGPVATVSVVGNTMLNGKSDDIRITNGLGLTVSDNVMSAGGRDTASINAVSLNYSVIAGNNISGTWKHGILVQGGASNIINGNNVGDSSISSSNSYDGINNASQETIIANNISGNSGVTGARVGIASSGDYCSINNNVCLRNKTSAFSLSGANISNRNNRDTTGATKGSAVLVAGTVTVNTAEIQAGDQVYLTCTTAGGTQGIVRVSAIVAGVSFTLTSSQGADTSTYSWRIEH